MLHRIGTLVGDVADGVDGLHLDERLLLGRVHDALEDGEACGETQVAE